ncbi:MAG: GMC oxidoreductase [Bdellovibrio sp.]
MNLDFDYIVIGSGFGGSVMACRLVEKGYRVCLLERGQQWKMHEFPRRPDEIQQRLFWAPEDKKFGMMEILDTPDSDVMTLTASGLGGGSLIYANVLLRMPEDFFKGWPGGLTRQKLDPYYDQVLNMMEARPYPFEKEDYYGQTPKTAGLQKISAEIHSELENNASAKFVLPPLAVRFDGEFPGAQSKNIHGAIQSKCNKCGECDLGCNIHAKNSLDLNYIFRALHPSANNKSVQPLEVRTQAEVSQIENPDQEFYKITYTVPGLTTTECVLTCKNVVLSAGSVGSSSLLLKMKEKGHLPKLNNWLGKKWCGNGDLLGMVLDTPEAYDPTRGPVITGAIQYRFENYPDGYPHGMYIEDAGFPIGLAWYLSGKVPQFKGILGSLKLIFRNIKNFFFKLFGIKSSSKEINIGDDFAAAIDKADFVRRSFMLLGMGRDRSDGEIQLRNNEPVILWKMDKSTLHFQRLRTEMKKIAKKMGGIFIDDPLTYLDKVIAVHPLGGCPMGDSSETGFVAPNGEVYGYPGLYVVDGSIIPTSVGPNPALTIAAIAEMIAAQIPPKNG